MKLVPPGVCGLASPVDAVAEAATDASWLRGFIEQIAARGEVLGSPRLAAARGRLALAEGRIDDARAELTTAVDGFLGSSFRLDAWHLGSALAEAEHRGGGVAAATDRLQRIADAADAAGARLAAQVARDTAARLGVVLKSRHAPDPAPQAEPVSRVPAGERMVSVLFADVRRYTELASHTAPADLADRIASLQRWAVQEVSRRNGIVDKFAGDAVMATFNVSGQSVDHTLQAFRAAVGIVDKASLAGLPVGAAVAVGPAVVGNLAESANVSVLGEVTNLASRLQSVAAAGEIMLSEEVYRRVKEWLDGQQIAAERVELELKGFGAPVGAYKVVTRTVATAPS